MQVVMHRNNCQNLNCLLAPAIGLFRKWEASAIWKLRGEKVFMKTSCGKFNYKNKN